MTAFNLAVYLEFEPKRAHIMAHLIQCQLGTEWICVLIEFLRPTQLLHFMEPSYTVYTC